MVRDDPSRRQRRLWRGLPVLRGNCPEPRGRRHKRHAPERLSAERSGSDRGVAMSVDLASTDIKAIITDPYEEGERAVLENGTQSCCGSQASCCGSVPAGVNAF